MYSLFKFKLVLKDHSLFFVEFRSAMFFLFIISNAFLFIFYIIFNSQTHSELLKLEGPVYIPRHKFLMLVTSLLEVSVGFIARTEQ